MRIVIVVGVIAMAMAIIFSHSMLPLGDQDPQKVSAVTVPYGALEIVLLPNTLSQKAQIGKQAFEVNCASCLGKNAADLGGVAQPTVHAIYEPGHHGNDSLQRAAAVGVRARHWPFGDMPAVEGVAGGNIKMVTAYIRELQHANGTY